MGRQFAGVLCALLLAGCVGRGPYRTLYPPLPAAGAPASGDDQRVVEEHPGFKLAFIEFDEKGRRQEGEKQLNAAVRTIRQARRLDLETGAKREGVTTGGLTILYIHGWKNNARSRAGQYRDVEKFRDALGRIAKELALDPQTMPVTGVYIGWRGRVLDTDRSLLTWWTLYSRYFVAGRLPGDPLQKSIARVIQAANAGRGLPHLPPDQRPRVVLVGHSLGARVLEGAVERAESNDSDTPLEQPLKKKGLVLGTCETLNDPQQAGGPKSPVDLVLLVNEATRSFKVRDAKRLCEPAADDVSKFVRHPGYDDAICDEPAHRNLAICRPYPLFVHIASNADLATRVLFPAALGSRTAPHSATLRTHTVTEIAARDDAPPGAVFTFETLGHGGDKRHHVYAVTSKRPEPNRQPVWVMRVAKPVIANHGDIWNPDFTNMLLNLMGGLEAVPLRQYSPEKRRMLRPATSAP